MKVVLSAAVAAAMLFAAPAMAETAAKKTVVEVTPAVEAVTISENYTLEDGTVVVVENDLVFIVGAEGARTAAPDGAHKTKEGKTLTVTNGALVVEDVVTETAE